MERQAGIQCGKAQSGGKFSESRKRCKLEKRQGIEARRIGNREASLKGHWEATPEPTSKLQ